VPSGQLRPAVKMTGPTTRGQCVLPEECLEVLIDGEDVMLLAGLRADDVARPDVVLDAFTEDASASPIDQPILIAIVVVAVESPTFTGHPEDPRRSDPRPRGTAVAVDPFRSDIEDRHVRTS
jgi:hypothetical protein